MLVETADMLRVRKMHSIKSSGLVRMLCTVTVLLLQLLVK